MKNDGTQTTQTSVLEAINDAINTWNEFWGVNEIKVQETFAKQLLASQTSNYVVTSNTPYHPFHSEGQGYWSRCKYCKETGLEFKNKHIAYCPHCRAMFRYRGE